MAWNGKVGIDLPYHAGPTYDIELKGDLKNVSSHLPVPLNKAAGEALPVNVKANGNLRSFELTGNAGSKNHFNSRWLLNQKLTLDRAIWTSESRTVPALPDQQGIELNLPLWMARNGWRCSRKAQQITLAPTPTSRSASRCVRHRYPRRSAVE